MNKTIRVCDETRGIVQITTADERWYTRPARDGETGLPITEYVPSTTWITSYAYKGIGFQKWLGNSESYEAAQEFKRVRGEKGSRVHAAIALLLEGESVDMDRALPDASGNAADLAPEEYTAVVAFRNWWKSLAEDREVLDHDFVVWGDGYAGTVDLLARWAGKTVLIDVKTSQQVYTEHVLQVTGYDMAMVHEKGSLDSEVRRPIPDALAILQVGYRGNRNQWKYTQVQPKPDLWEATRVVWAHETKGQKPQQIELPMSVNLNLKPREAR